MARAPKDLPPAEGLSSFDRQQIALWAKEKFEEIDRAKAERIELLRTGKEHPCPIFATQVRNHGALGMPKRLVAKMLGITLNTLETFYTEDYDIGAADILSQVAANMMRIATSTTDPAASKVGMEVLERRLGEDWAKPANKLELDDKRNKGAPPIIDSSKLTREERDQLEAMLMRIDSITATESIELEQTDEVIGEKETTQENAEQGCSGEPQHDHDETVGDRPTDGTGRTESS